MIKLPEPVLYQYRWTTLKWKDIAPACNQTVAQKCDELLAYRYKGEPVYEVRALVTEDQLKQAVRDALELAFQVAGPEDSYQDEHFKAKADSAMRIRALIKEIPE